jgi:DnaJ-class molecular chaperone
MNNLPEQTLQDWDKLQEENEKAQQCPLCKGIGHIWAFSRSFRAYKEAKCPKCFGNGLHVA